MSRVVLFRADGGPGIGMGHLMRCRTLAIALQKLGWKATFLGTGLPESGFSDIVETPFSALDPDQHGRNGLGTARAAEEIGADLVVIDSYSFGMQDFLALWKGGRTLAVIDDLADRGLPVDVVINPNPLFPETRYRQQGVSHCLVGAAFTLIRPEIFRLQGKRSRGVRKLLVTLGGGNLPEFVPSFLEMLSGHEFDRICVMAPSSAPVEPLLVWARQQPETREVCRDFVELPVRLDEATAVVTGAGSTLWEAYFLGKPSLAIVWAENQRQAVKVTESCHTGTICDLRQGFEMETLKNSWNCFLATLTDAEMIARQRQLIDGLGAERVADYLHGLSR